MQNVGLTFSLICDTCRYKRHWTTLPRTHWCH
jgi:hypothetical protein